MTKQTAGSDDDYGYSLFQQLLSAATRPSPIKAIFTKDELEVLIDYLFTIFVV